MNGAVTLQSDALRVTLTPHVGGTITRIEHKATGLSVLGSVPWQPVDAPLVPPAAPDERTWLTRYTGGWPLLFPNGGDACEFAGRFHGFHGEAAISSWAAEAGSSTIRLSRRFEGVPVHMVREIGIVDELVAIRETAVAEGDGPVTVMWGHHPTFGSDLLDGEFDIRSGAAMVTADQGYDPPANPLRPGAVGRWPMLDGKKALVDLGQAPTSPIAALAYLRDFSSAWISIRRLDNEVAATLSWDAGLFPFAWLWLELGGTPDAPWNGRTRLIGLEPSTTCLASGLAEADRRGERLLTLQPGVPVVATIRLHVFQPSGRISGVALDGRSLTSCP